MASWPVPPNPSSPGNPYLVGCKCCKFAKVDVGAMTTKSWPHVVSQRMEYMFNSRLMHDQCLVDVALMCG